MVRNIHTRETDLCETGGLQVDIGWNIVYQGRYGQDVGSAIGPVSDRGRSIYKSVYRVERIATQADMEQHRRHEEEAARASKVCAERVEAHGLDMRVVSAHYLLDRSKLLFFFVSDHRVDFRNLVRDLVSRFHVRVELRQIGVRDETRILGGMGICGRRLCCNGVSDRLAPVSIRMAKNQNYSLNSMKVSGPCGRLLCCLAYEHDFYQDERKRYPREGTLVNMGGDVFRVQEINILSKQVRMFGPGGQCTSVPICALTRRESTRGRGKRQQPEWEVTPQNCPAACTAIDQE
ncbi:MAG: hypothetical protein MI724_06925 [Spirochaetales bacterium]|nr:hypothetical protein [Spirochaetales bacterium]